jgi:hypothetical protein
VLNVTQALYWCHGSNSGAAKFLSSFITSRISAHFSPSNSMRTPVHHSQMSASRFLSSLILHACDAIDSSHPLHVIASDTVESVAAVAVREVEAVSSSPPSSASSSLPCTLFVAAAIASRTGSPPSPSPPQAFKHCIVIYIVFISKFLSDELLQDIL